MIIQPGTIHVWATRLEASPDAVARAARTLSPDERARAARFRGQHLERRFVVSRAAVRRVLARYRGEDPAAIAFELGPHGKPLLSGDEPPFSVSHSGDVAVIAVSGAGPVGVDVEEVRLIPELEQLAARTFARDEAATLAALPAADRANAFFRIWTAKEAYVKALGVGLAMPLDAFTVTAVTAITTVTVQRAAPVAARGDAARFGAWWTRHFEPFRGFIGAVATSAADATVVEMGPVE